MNWWGGPLVRTGRPRPPVRENQLTACAEEPTRESGADKGVRSTICAIARRRQEYVALARTGSHILRYV